MARKQLIRGLSVLGLLTTLVVVPSVAGADGSGLDKQPMVRKQLLHRGGRHELTVDLGATMADAFARNVLLGGTYQYYFNNWLGVGLSLGANLCGVAGDVCKTALAEDVEATNPNLNTLDGLSVFSLVAIPHLSLVPITGKFGAFGKVLHYDMHLMAGGALVRVGSLGEESSLDDTILGPVLGVGQRVFLSDSMAVTVSVKDLILSRTLNTNESGDKADTEYENNLVFSVGLNFYFPSNVSISR